MSHLRSSRRLRDVAQFEVQLFLDLQFVDEATASELETFDVANVNVIHFCNAVQAQISGSIVKGTAASYNATIIGGGGLDCIQGLTRVYDPEAVDVFGEGYFSLQVHVSQAVVVESTHLLWLELVETIAETGFAKSSGGSIQFRSRLQLNPMFGTVISVEIRRGLAAPVMPPTPFPTFTPSSTPTFGPSNQPSITDSNSPSNGPSTVPTHSPSQYPSGYPSLQPSTTPTDVPSILPSVAASVLQAFPTPAIENNVDLNLASSGSFDTPVIAAIVGATVMLLTAVVFSLLLLFRCQSKKNRRKEFPDEIALSKRDFRGKHVIPTLLELGDDHQSLAETSIGDYTAGAGPEPSKKKISRKSIRPLGSFDENSLYTTPYSVKPDNSESATQPRRNPKATPTINWKLDMDDLPELSDLNHSSEKFVHERFVISEETGGSNHASKASVRKSTPVDVDSLSPYNGESHRITKIEPLSNYLPSVAESDAFSQGMNSDFDEEFTRDASELDVWSCDFENFDDISDSEVEERYATSISRKKHVGGKYILGGSSSDSDSSFDVSESPFIKPQQNQEKGCLIVDQREGKALGPFHLSIKDAGKRILGDLLKNTDPPPPPSQSPVSTQSSKTSIGSFSSRKAYPGTKEFRTGSPARQSLNGKENAKPMTKLLDSLSIPAATPEGNESDLSEYLEGSDESRGGLGNDPTVFEEDDDSGMSTSPWLMEETEKILGPRSSNADTESLSGKSSRSLHSKLIRGRKNGSETSFGSGSRFSAHQISSVMSAVSSSMSADVLEQTGGEIAIKASKETLRNDKKRLEAQLAQIAALENDQSTTASSVTLTTIPGASLSTLSHKTKSKVKRRRKIVVLAPPGKLGVILANRHDGNGTVVAELRPDSPLEGMLSTGDKLVAVDNRNVEQLQCSQITSLIAARAEHYRRLTVITFSG